MLVSCKSLGEDSDRRDLEGQRDTAALDEASPKLVGMPQRRGERIGLVAACGDID